MKRRRVWIWIGLLLIVGWATDVPGKFKIFAKEGPTLAVTSAVMLDAETGEWLYRSDSNKPLPPASMSKMMTEAIVLDGIRFGDYDWDEAVIVSDYAARVGGAGMGLVAGQKATVRELFNAMAVHSANDATVALAEFIAGSEAVFVERMNEKASEIGLSKKTYFANSTGLSSKDLSGFANASASRETIMTAEDAALLAKYLIDDHPELLKTTKKATVNREGEAPALVTTNEMLPGQRFGMKGNDGLKTGYTERAGYCFTGTTVIDGRRYITVVMGAASPESRFEETKKLLEYAKEIAS